MVAQQDVALKPGGVSNNMELPMLKHIDTDVKLQLILHIWAGSIIPELNKPGFCH